VTGADKGNGADPLGGLGGGALPPEEHTRPEPHGHPAPPEGGPKPRESAKVRFRRVRQVAPMTLSLIAVLGLAFFLQSWAGGWSTSDRSALYRLGALHWVAVLDGDWWRLGSYAFLHVGFAHFLLNSWAIWVLMRPLEGVFGGVGSLGLWTLGAVAGGAASMAWARHGGNPWIVAAGASGGVASLFGARLGLVLRLRKKLGPQELKAELANLFITVLLNVALAFEAATGGIPLDNAAHLGGLAAGALAAALMPIPALGVKLRERLVGLFLLATAFGLAAMEGAAAARAVRPHTRALDAKAFTADLPWQLVPLRQYDGIAIGPAGPLRAELVRDAEPLAVAPDELPEGAELVQLGGRAWVHQRAAFTEGQHQGELLVQLLSPDGDGRLRVEVTCYGPGCGPLAESAAAQIARTLRTR
jgi:rhomboid protease GluP